MRSERDRPRVRLGIVLSSGGVRGVYAHTGFLLALREMGVEVDAVAGCSAGAVVGGVFASGTDLQKWADTLATVQPRQFWQPRWLHFLWSMLFRQGRACTGIASTEPARNFCRENLSVRRFEDCQRPFHALAINIATGRKKVFSSGDLATSMVASGAIPLLYQPVEIDGELYCDGALIDLAPTDAICCQHELDVLIVHHVAQRAGGTASLKQAIQGRWAMIEILNRLLYQQRPWYLSDDLLAFRRCPCGCGAIVVVVEPDLPELSWPLTHRGPEVMAAARLQARRALEPHLEDLCHDPRRLDDKVEESSVGVGSKP